MREGSFPYQLIPGISKIPFTLILTVFPFYVLAGVRYSPKAWGWKIPFYWVLVHIGVLAESIIEKYTMIIKYKAYRKPENRKPMDSSHLRFGSLGWFLTHFLLIVTFILAGTMLAKTLFP